VKKKKLKYKPIRQDEILDIGVALSQASALLDQAAAKGIREDNVDILLNVADRWIAIAGMFTEGTEEEHVDISDPEVPFGFAAPQNEIEDEEEVNEEDE